MPEAPRPKSSQSGRRQVWRPVAGAELATIGDLVGAARAVALTGEQRSGELRGALSGLVHTRKIEGMTYAADPHGHAVEVQQDGVVILARWRDAAARMVHLARTGCRGLIGRHYRLTHLLQPGRVWIGARPAAGHHDDLVVIEGVEGRRVRLRRVWDGTLGTARIERFDGRSKGYHPANDELAELASSLLQRRHPSP